MRSHNNTMAFENAMIWVQILLEKVKECDLTDATQNDYMIDLIN